MDSAPLNLKILYDKKVSQLTSSIIDPARSGKYELIFNSEDRISIYIILISIDDDILIIVIEQNTDEESESNINLYGFIFESTLLDLDFNTLLDRLYNISKYRNQANMPIHHSYVYLVTETEILESELEQLLNNPNNNLKIKGIRDGQYIINGLDFLVFRPDILPSTSHASIIVKVYNKQFIFSLDAKTIDNENITYFPFKIETSLLEGDQHHPLVPVEDLEHDISDDAALHDLLAQVDQVIATAEEFHTTTVTAVADVVAASAGLE